MTHATSVVHMIDAAPPRITLRGDKKKKPESAEHIIEFPGGAIAVARTTDGNYWAHIVINRKEKIPDAEGRVSKFGRLAGGRIDTEDGVLPVPGYPGITHLALLIEAMEYPAEDLTEDDPIRA